MVALHLLSMISLGFRSLFGLEKLITANMRMQTLIQVQMGRPDMYE